jgi:beta-lactamase class A
MSDLLDPVLRTAPSEAAVSVWMGDLTGTAWLARDAEMSHPAASTMKLPLLVALHREAAAGRLDLDAEVPVLATTPSVVPGAAVTVTQDYDNDDAPWDALGEPATLRWLGERAVLRSSNLATNLLLQHVGLGAVAAVLADAGARHTYVRRGIQDFAAFRANSDGNVVTAVDLARVWQALAGGRLLDASTSRELEGLLRRVEHDDAIPAGLPAGTCCAHKPGWIEGACHDAALVRPDGEPPFILVVLTQAELDEEPAHRFVADIARACWNARSALAQAA